jgi:hypothetical protein
MLAFNRLRIDPGEGSPAMDYRIEDGFVEKRLVESGSDASSEDGWRRLTPEELSAHVITDTVVAHWLSRRMGVRRLIRACNQPYSSFANEVQERSDQTAA